MPRRSPRPFTLADLMALIAATACGIALARWVETPLGGPPKPGVPARSSISIVPGTWFDYIWLKMPSCLAACWTAALVLLRWSRPRPRSLRIMRQPGAVACLASVVGLLLGGSLAWLEVTIRRAAPPFNLVGANAYYWGTAVWMTCPAVGGAWAAQRVGGSWRPERSWIDWLGRVLGAYWLAWYPFVAFRTILSYWVPYPQ